MLYLNFFVTLKGAATDGELQAGGPDVVPAGAGADVMRSSTSESTVVTWCSHLQSCAVERGVFLYPDGQGINIPMLQE